MIPKEILEMHYKEYANLPDNWVLNMAATKESIVKKVIDLSKFESEKNNLSVAVLGASDKRYIQIHENVFRKILNKEIDMKTLGYGLSLFGLGYLLKSSLFLGNLKSISWRKRHHI